MANQIPLKVILDDSNNTCGLAQFGASDTLAVAIGGTGLTTQGVCAFAQPGINAVACKSTYIGICAAKSEAAADENTYVGYAAGQNVTTGCYHTIIGSNAGDAITTCSGSVLIGYNAGTAITMGDFNTLVGTAAGAAVVTASNNTVIGYHAATATICSNNVAIGTCALVANTQGQGNIAIGLKAGATQVAAGCNNIFIGSSAGAVSLCRDNIMIGNNAGIAATTGGGNIMIGACVGYGVVGGDGNVYIGDKAGLANTSGNDNVFIGKCAGCASTASCTLVIGNGTCDLITGAFNTPSLTLDADTFVSNGKGVVVGSTARQNVVACASLQVLGTALCDSSMVLGIWANDAVGPTINFGKSRNTTIGSRTEVADDDILGPIGWTADDGVDMTNQFARLGVRVDDSAGPGKNQVATEMFFGTSDTAGNYSEKMVIGPTGVIKFSNAYCFPTADGSADQVLCTDGSGALKFVDMASSSQVWSTSGCFITTPSDCFVGISTTAPEELLHVFGGDSGATAVNYKDIVVENSGNAGISILAGTTSCSAINFGDSGDADIGQVHYNHTCNNMSFAVSGGVAVTINNAKKVGIGTAAPTQPLHVLHADNTIAKFESSDATSAVIIQDNGSTNEGNKIVVVSDAMSLYTAGSESMSIDADGAITKPLNPAFLTCQTTAQTNLTGDGTFATVDFGTEVFDQGGNLSGSTFTAPVAGRYQFTVHLRAQGLLSGHTAGFIYMRTSNNNYQPWFGNHYAWASVGEVEMASTMILDMDAADTAYVQIYVAGSTKVVDLPFGAQVTFSGYLIA